MSNRNEHKEGYKKTKLGWIPEEWEIFEFGEIFNFSKSYSFSRNDLVSKKKNGELFYFHYGDIHSGFSVDIIDLKNGNLHNVPYLKSDRKINKPEYLEEGDLIIADVSEDYEGVGKCIEVGKVSPKSAVAGLHTIVARDKKGKTKKRFRINILRNQIVSREVKKIATGASVKGISKSELKKLKVIIPPLSEQQKIAEILSTWDEAIQTLQKLISAKKKHKKALMLQLLSGKKRFKEFEGEWEEVKLKQIVNRVTERNKDEKIQNVLTISAQNGLISQGDYYKKSVASKNLSNYFAIKKGDFAYNKSYSDGYPFGAIKRLEDYSEGVLSPLYICFRVSQKNIDIKYLSQFFEYGGLNHGIFRIAREGARNHGLLNVSLSDFFDLKLSIPSYEEQTKIGGVLNKADEEIKALKEKRDALQAQKKGLMQQLLTGRTRVTHLITNGQ